MMPHDSRTDQDASPAVVGRVSLLRVRLRVQQLLFTYNPSTGRSPLAPVFHGRFEAAAGGALLRGRFRLAWFAYPTIAVWCLGFVLVLVDTVSTLPSDPDVFGYRGLDRSLPPLWMALMIGLAVMYWRLGQTDRQEIVGLIVRTLDAKHV